MANNGYTFINQSLIKKFFFKGVLRDYCPYSIYCQDIAKTHDRSSDSMLAGSYFETMVLGSGVRGQITHDLKRKKITAKQAAAGVTIGEKTIDQQRIEKQAMIFANDATKYQISVNKNINTQIEIFKQFSKNDNVVLKGELDLFPTPILLPQRGMRLACIDLKLTGRFTDFGEYCWLTPESMDHTQGHMYHELMRDIDIDLNNSINPDNKLQHIYTDAIKNQLDRNETLFFYWVFTYKEPEIRNKFVEVVYNYTNRIELFETIRRVLEELNKNERNGWNHTVSNAGNCQGCAVIECPNKFVSSKPETESNNFEQV